MGHLRSPLLGFAVHGFSTREGGISTGRYATLNLGRKWGDDPACVAENHAILGAEAGYDPDALRTARQVHGVACVVADGLTPTEVAALEADAVLATTPGAAVGVYTADCVPILFSDGKGRVAAAHAGWRGTVAGIGPVTVKALVDAGARREDLRAALGPSIGPCCFEVGDEVADAFLARLPGVPGLVRREGLPAGKAHVDLWAANRVLLIEAGLSPDQVEATPPCTMCDASRFYSFRRDGGSIGQMLSFIVAG